jgi:uncharacterized membrane protein (DUF2068 family)
MTEEAQPHSHVVPGVAKPHRFRPRFHYELLMCGLRGHQLLGDDARKLRPEDAVFAREEHGGRWYRCLRCDGWVPMKPPQNPTREYPPDPIEVKLPLRGKPLRDQVVLRLIAVFKGIKGVFIALAAIGTFLLVGHEDSAKNFLHEVLKLVQGTNETTGLNTGPRWFQTLHHLFFETMPLWLLGICLTAYAALLFGMAVGLWITKRWGEYLAVVALTVLYVPEIYELTRGVTVVKIILLVLNTAIIAYLVFGKRLFGIRGGGKVDEEHLRRDVSWEALQRTAPPAQ